eukprot:1054_1
MGNILKPSSILISALLYFVVLAKANAFNISCGEEECQRTTLDCMDDVECNIICSGISSCAHSTINGNNATSMNVLCTYAAAGFTFTTCYKTKINGNNAASMTVLCDGYDTSNCYGAIIHGGTANSMNVTCHTCYGSIINGNNSTSMTVLCDGPGSCWGSNITGINNVICRGEESCKGTYIVCSDDRICNVSCSGFWGCAESIIKGVSATQLNLKVIADVDEIMVGSQIYCPNDGFVGNTNNCNFYVEGFVNDTHIWQNASIFAVEGFNDLNIHCTDRCFPKQLYTPVMFCKEEPCLASCDVNGLNNKTDNFWGCINIDAECHNYLASHITNNSLSYPLTDCYNNIGLGDGIFELLHSIRSKYQYFIIHGGGVENTLLNDSSMNGIECEDRCRITIKNLTYITSNNQRIQIFNGAHAEFYNVKFYGTLFNLYDNANITFINCQFLQYKVEFFNLFDVGYGTRVYFTNTVFKQNIFHQDMMLINGANVIFDNVKFVNNKGGKSAAGNEMVNLIKSINDDNYIEIKYSLFNENYDFFSFIHQNSFNGLISVNDNIFENNVNMTHLLQIFESNSITNIQRNHFVDNNKCDNYCL